MGKECDPTDVSQAILWDPQKWSCLLLEMVSDREINGCNPANTLDDNWGVPPAIKKPPTQNRHPAIFTGILGG